MKDTELVQWIKKKKIKLPPSDTRAIYTYNDDFQVSICNLNFLGCKNMWLVTYETEFLKDDIEIWNGFIINKKKEILEYVGK